jgi:hypothetical protein
LGKSLAVAQLFPLL